MSGCNVRRGFCLEHQCWTDEVRCRVSYLAAEVERLNSLLTLVAGKHMAAQERIDAALRLLDRCEEDTRDFYGGEGSPVVLTQYVRDALDGGEPLWRGLHNPDYHEDITEYEVERLTAELEVLRAQVKRVRDVLGDDE